MQMRYNVGVNQTSPPSVPPQIPVRLQRYEHGRHSTPHPFWLHPASGACILAIDWFFFGAEVITFEIALVFACFFAFTITTAAVFWIQRTKAGDSFGSAAVKGLFGGVVAGLPTSVAGTLLGTAVLVLSGLSRWNQRRDSR